MLDQEYEYLRLITLQKHLLLANAALHPERRSSLPNTEYDPPSRAGNTTRKIESIVRRNFSEDEARNKNTCTLKSSHSDSSLTALLQVEECVDQFVNDSSKFAKREERAERTNRFENIDNGHRVFSQNDSGTQKKTDNHNDSFTKRKTDNHNDSFTKRKTDGGTYYSTGNIETTQTAVVYGAGCVPQTPMHASTMRMRSNTRDPPPTPMNAARQPSYSNMLTEQAKIEFQ